MKTWFRLLQQYGIHILTGLIILVVGGVLLLIHYYTNRQIGMVNEMVVQEAVDHFESMVIARRWNAKNGGVLVYAREGMKPNKYLEDNHDFTRDGKLLIKINPAWMTRQISEIANERRGYYYKITSLKPLNPANEPDDFEKKALESFEANKESPYFYEFSSDGKFNFMGALKTEKACLKCHQKQGYNEGDIRGGIRVTLPMDLYSKEIQLIESRRNYLFFTLPMIAMMILLLAYRFQSVLSRTQKQLMTSERMASLGNLVGGVAHEINTPVGVAISSVSHLKKITEELKDKYKKGEVSEEEFEQYIADVIELSSLSDNNLNRAASLVKSLKQVAVDRSVEEAREIDLLEYINETLLSLRNRVKHTKINITVDCQTGVMVKTYPGAISQIITNFIINSLTHGFSPGEQGEILIQVTKKGKLVRLNYSDTGKGIDSKDLDRIFEPFFTTNRMAGNTGLGLHIVYNLIHDRLGGSVRAESKPGEGISFLIEFESMT